MLKIQNLTKSFNGFVATNGVDLTIAESERHAIIGPNGAGKSTLFNLITGHLRPDSGTVIYRGEEITGMKPHTIVRKGVSRSFQHTNVYPKLTVFENMQAALIAHHRMEYRFFTLAKKLFRDEALELLAAVGMAEDADRVAGTLAYGRQKQLELAVGLASEPNFLLLDEPTAGMSGHGNPPGDRPHRANYRGAEADPSLYRARHGGRLRDCRSHQRSLLRKDPLHRNSRGGACRSRGEARISGGKRSWRCLRLRRSRPPMV